MIAHHPIVRDIMYSALDVSANTSASKGRRIMSTAIEDALLSAWDTMKHERIDGSVDDVTSAVDRKIDAYITHLSHLNDELVVEAIHDCVRLHEWFPSVKEIIDAAIKLAGGAYFVDPETAWEEVLTNASRFGIRRKRVTWAPDGERAIEVDMSWSSPLIEQAAESIGWEDICLSTHKERNTLRAQFRDDLAARQARFHREIATGRTPVQAISAGDVTRRALRSSEPRAISAFTLVREKGRS